MVMYMYKGEGFVANISFTLCIHIFTFHCSTSQCNGVGASSVNYEALLIYFLVALTRVVLCCIRTHPQPAPACESGR